MRAVKARYVNIGGLIFGRGLAVFANNNPAMKTTRKDKLGLIGTIIIIVAIVLLVRYLLRYAHVAAF